MDALADHRNFHCITGIPSFAATEFLHAEDHRRARLSLHFGGCPACVQTGYAHPVDRHDFITALQPCLVCRRIHIWLIDNDIALFRRLVDDGADSAVGLAQHELEILIVLLGNIHRVRVQVRKHCLDTGLFNAVERERVHVRTVQFLEYGVLDFDPLPQFEILRLPEDRRRSHGQCRCRNH